MPLYEFRCRACQATFEALVLPSSPGPPECPSCQGRDLEQLLSAFGVHSAEHSKAVWRAARKQYEKTELRDKKVAEAEAVQHHMHDHD
jgi:putative FmdB family regulatory protein